MTRHFHRRDASERRTARNRSSASGRANCSPLNPETKRPPRISPCASLRRRTGSRSRQGGASVSRASRSRNSTPQRSSKLIGEGSGAGVGGGQVRSVPHQRPASGGMPRTRMPSPPFSAAALGIDQRSQILETIGGHQPGGHQFPKPVFHFARQPASGADQVGEERRAALLELRQHFAGGMRERGALRTGSGAASHSALSRRKMAMGAVRVGRTRRGSADLRRPDAATAAPTSLRRTGTARSRNSGS